VIKTAMPLQLNDTIAALSTAQGAGGRAIVRISGPQAAAVVSTLGSFSPFLLPVRRSLLEAQLILPGLTSSLPSDVYVLPAPGTYTGEELVEIHILSSPPLVELLVAELLQAGARAAQPGEFTLRAFLSGRLDLTRAEAVLGVIEAGDRFQLKQALGQLAGGVGRPMQELRDDLLNLLADIEAGLDFTEEDIHFVQQEDLLKRIGKALAHLLLLNRQLEKRAVSGRPFRVVLAGRPNAGKSSLFNALAGASALVSPQPGTTRDYLVQQLDLDGLNVELTDTAGLCWSENDIEEASQALGRGQVEQGDLVLLCLEGGRAQTGQETALLTQSAIPVLAVTTKSDLEVGGRERASILATSAVTGEGIVELRALLRERAGNDAQPPLAPSLSRCRNHVQGSLEHLRRAHAIVLYEDPPELLALELRETLQQLGEMVGAVYTDDLLDRIFSRFCIGK
jgi:tRNA modification GTPase